MGRADTQSMAFLSRFERNRREPSGIEVILPKRESPDLQNEEHNHLL